MLGIICVLNAILYVATSETVILQRMKRQNDPSESGHVVDSIFNIPITAIKQTGAAVQTFSPENSKAIDSILKIPVSTLEAVGALVKQTSGQRLQNAEELQRIRQERRERILAQRERQRFQREQLQQQRFKQQQMKRNIKNNNKDLFGLNTLSFLVSNHGILGSIQGPFGGYSGFGGGHGGHGGHGNQGIHGGQGSTGGYEVHENVEEDTNYFWHGITAGFGTISGSRPSSAHISIQNKVAPKDKRPNKSYDDFRIQNKIAPNKENGLDYEDDPPLQNKIAPKRSRISFQS
ncbi:uncharacterized protein LOC132907615 [Bombus pascuorum]|uniref:uncharacterized protein LOC132907615 n=1 Tax=Bombus pascuorum TaxID=65598 RepID=UPI0021349B8C|nr:uncharacterized protein LOC132907615 [Bombus pascuorum]